MNWVLWLRAHLGKGNSGRGQVREGVKWKGEAWCSMNSPGHGQLSVCPLQATGTEHEVPSGGQQTSGPQGIYQQTGVAVGPHPWGVRGFAQAQLQAMWGWNPGWVLYCFSWSLPGTQTHMWGHTHTHRQVPCAVLNVPLPQAQTGTEAQSGDQALCATSSQPMDPCCPSEETSAPTPNPTN